VAQLGLAIVAMEPSAYPSIVMPAHAYIKPVCELRVHALTLKVKVQTDLGRFLPTRESACYFASHHRFLASTIVSCLQTAKSRSAKLGNSTLNNLTHKITNPAEEPIRRATIKSVPSGIVHSRHKQVPDTPPRLGVIFHFEM
jgi:hypothetical protein